MLEYRDVWQTFQDYGKAVYCHIKGKNFFGCHGEKLTNKISTLVKIRCLKKIVEEVVSRLREWAQKWVCLHCGIVLNTCTQVY